MKVSELMRLLAVLPQDAEVLVMEDDTCSAAPGCGPVYKIDDVGDITEPQDVEKTVVIGISDAAA